MSTRGPRAGARPGAEAPGSPPPLTVLLVAEDPATRALARRVVRGDHLVVAGDLAAGVDLATRTPPDLALVDITLGQGAGLALVHHLKALAPEATVYAMSTPDTLEAAAHAVALGGAGLMMLPLSGDEVLSTLGEARQRVAERRLLAELQARERARELEPAAPARTTRLLARAAELAEQEGQRPAARALADLLVEATGAARVAVYLPPVEGGSALLQRTASVELDDAPAACTEAEALHFADRLGLRALPLAVRRHRLGLALTDGILAQHDEAGLLGALLAQASTALALLGERERATSAATIKDPTSSAYSFAYYVDVAGREIDKARRHQRRFAIVTIQADVAQPASLRPGAPHPAGRSSPAEIARRVLRAVRDTDVLARVDEGEFHLLLSETDGLGAHACRRRVLGRLVTDASASVPGEPISEIADLPMVGVASFPHDGQDLSQLLRVAKRRGEQTCASPAFRLAADTSGLSDLLARLVEEASRPSPPGPFALRPLHLPLVDAASLVTAVVADAKRGGSAFIAASHHARLCLGAAARAAAGALDADSGIVFHALDLRHAEDAEDLEAVSILCEHGAYALLARHEDGLLRGVHAADPLLADLLGDRLGRAANLRILG